MTSISTPRPKQHLWWLLVPVWLALAVVMRSIDNFDVISTDLEGLAWILVQGALLITGVLILSNRPGNRIGRRLTTGGVTFTIGWLLLIPLDNFARWWGSDAAGLIEAIGAAIATMWPVLIAAALIIFPNEHLISTRWRKGQLSIWGTLALAVLAPLTNGGWGGDISEVAYTNPLREPLAPLGDILQTALGIGLGVSMLIAASSVVVRFRASSGAERQQIKWLALAMTLVALWLPLDLIQPGTATTGWIAIVGSVLLSFVIVSIALAVLRYRLFDIDRIISRAVVYVIVVGLLGVIFGLGAIWIPTAVTGDEVPSIYVAGSTLVVVALFNPIRQRVLGWVDRRFNRSRYDAERVIAGFGEQVRDVVESEILAEELTGIVSTTMQPSRVGVWLRRT